MGIEDEAKNLTIRKIALCKKELSSQYVTNADFKGKSTSGVCVHLKYDLGAPKKPQGAKALAMQV